MINEVQFELNLDVGKFINLRIVAYNLKEDNLIFIFNRLTTFSYIFLDLSISISNLLEISSIILSLFFIR